jgi:F0F1-type ATP synthase epsilon subunit
MAESTSRLPSKLTLEVVTPEGLLLRELVDEVIAPGALGYFGVSGLVKSATASARSGRC